jgi:thiol-disulfide isomerase/thioredoxin
MAALCTAVSAMAAGGTKVGDKFPDLAKLGLEGTLPDLKGKVLMVDFWASWCIPCKRSFPLMKELHEKYADKGLVIVAVSVDDNRREMQKFLADYKTPFTVVRDAKEDLANKVRPPGMPTSYFVKADGTVQTIISDTVGDDAQAKYSAAIEEVLKSNPAKP